MSHVNRLGHIDASVLCAVQTTAKLAFFCVRDSLLIKLLLIRARAMSHSGLFKQASFILLRLASSNGMGEPEKVSAYDMLAEMALARRAYSAAQIFSQRAVTAARLSGKDQLMVIALYSLASSTTPIKSELATDYMRMASEFSDNGPSQERTRVKECAINSEILLADPAKRVGAEVWCEAELYKIRQAYPELSKRVAFAEMNQARAFAGNGFRRKATAVFRIVLAKMERLFCIDSLPFASVAFEFSKLLMQVGKVDEACMHLHALIWTWQNTIDWPHPNLLEAMEMRTECVHRGASILRTAKGVDINDDEIVD